MADEIPLNFVDNPHAPDFFAAEATGFFHLNGTIMITFESLHVNHETTPGPVNRVVVGRLVMPAQGAHNLATQLFNFLKSQKIEFPQSDSEARH